MMPEQTPSESAILDAAYDARKDWYSGEYVMTEAEAAALDPNQPNKPRPKIKPQSLPIRQRT
jgi:hypothetical protein